MASADFSAPIAPRCRFATRIARERRRSPWVRQWSFLRSRPDLPVRSPNDYWASPPIAGLPHRTGLISGFCSSAPDFASSFLPTPPRGDAVAFS